jgi:hypothetical protein
MLDDPKVLRRRGENRETACGINRDLRSDRTEYALLDLL